MMDIQVLIHDKAKDVINDRGNLLTISLLSIDNCCVPIGEVNVQYEKPENLQMYYTVQTDNIFIYLDKRLDIKNQSIEIKPTGIGPFRTVRVEGISYF